MTTFRVENIYKVFGRRPKEAVAELKRGRTRAELASSGTTAAVIDASFEVAPGETFVVMGLSGSGKSTLIRMLNGLLPATDGHVYVDDKDVASLDGKELRALRQQTMSMVFQHFALFPHRTVRENAEYALKVRGIEQQERSRLATEALHHVGLQGWEEHMPDQLSGGMRQRVGLARALAADTEILLMDEAFSALDPLIRRDMQDQLLSLQSELGKTIIFITHDLNEAMRLGDRIAMMREGRIVQVGTAEQILNDPANDYVAQFVQDVDRTRVLTAHSVMEKPVITLGSGSGPRAALRTMREHQLSGLYVTDRDRTLLGMVSDTDVAEGVNRGLDTIQPLISTSVLTVSPDTVVADLFQASAESVVALPVVNGTGQLVGVVPRVTLLAALGQNTSQHTARGNDQQPGEQQRDEAASESAAASPSGPADSSQVREVSSTDA